MKSCVQHSPSATSTTISWPNVINEEYHIRCANYFQINIPGNLKMNERENIFVSFHSVTISSLDYLINLVSVSNFDTIKINVLLSSSKQFKSGQLFWCVNCWPVITNRTKTVRTNKLVVMLVLYAILVHLQHKVRTPPWTSINNYLFCSIIIEQ